MISHHHDRQTDHRTTHPSTLPPLSPWYIRHLLSIIHLMCLVAAIGSAIMTSRSIYDKAVEASAADTVGIVTALITAIIAGMLVGGGQMLLFTVTVNAHKSQQKQIWGLTCVLLLFTFTISSYANITATAGAPSITYSLRDKVVEYTDFVEIATAHSANAAAAADALAPLENSVCGMLKNERKRGMLSGSPGDGAITAAYSSSCLSIQTIVKTLRDSAVTAEQRHDDMASILETMNTIPDDVSVTVFERQAQFRQKATRLRKLVAEARNAKTAKTLEAQMTIMEKSVATLDVRDGAFGQKQSDSVRGLKESLAQVTQAIALLTEDAAMATPPGNLPDMSAAIFIYAERNIQNIFISIFVDGFSVFLVFLLGVARRTAELRHREAHDGAS